MKPMEGQRYVIFGVASDSSLAWGIAKELASLGAQLTLGYQKRFLSRVRELVKTLPEIERWEECDLASEDSTAAFFSKLEGSFDGVVHAVAYAPPEALSRPIVETTEEDFSKTLGVSSYSLVRVVRHALPKLKAGASFLTLTYLGSERVVPGYRVMGTAKAALESLVRELAASVGPLGYRVNAISAGPVKTLAASGVPGFDLILDWVEANAPLRRNVTQSDVAKAARFLLSPDASAITGQILFVDSGFSIVGAPPVLERILVEPELSFPEGPR